jgi:von Willebrand factor type A domain
MVNRCISRSVSQSVGRTCPDVCIPGDTASAAWNLDTYAANTDDLLASITVDNIPDDGGGTNLTAALIAVRQNVMSPSGGDRPGFPNVCVLITSGAGSASGFSDEAARTRSVCRLIIVNVGNSNVSNHRMISVMLSSSSAI